jgi:tetratricopeptide (TPR) repeat protein
MTTGELLWIAQECFAHGLDELGREILEGEVRRFGTDPFYVGSPVKRGDVLHFLGRNEEAFALYKELAEAHPNSPWQGLYQMGMIAPLLGDTALALEIDRRIAEWPREAGNPASFPLVRAQIQANLGNLEEAFRLLDESYFRYGRLFRIENHAIFDLLPLQGYPPYDELMKGVG